MFLVRLLLLTAVAVSIQKPEVRRPEAEPRQSAAAKKACCFTNPAYTGTCKVEPGEDETCASILSYLNNPMAQGKSYCGGTEVRQGWTEVSCEDME